MDPDVVEQIGQGIRHQAELLRHVAAQVGSVVQQAEHAWQGHDAVRFRDHWASSLHPQLAELCADLEHFAMTAQANARDQRATSQA